jgi:integrase
MLASASCPSRTHLVRVVTAKACRLCGIPHKRHTFASTALAEGVPISEVSRWLGHKSITTTVDLYGHLVPEATARARTALDGAFA